MGFHSLLRTSTAALALVGLSAAALAAPAQQKAAGTRPVKNLLDDSQAASQPSKIGIFDLAAIRAVPLDPEVIKKTETDGIVTEYVRFTSVPGVRVLAILSYKRNSKALPGILFAQRFEAAERTADAKQGFMGVSVAPPIGNDDPKKMASIGGPSYSIQASYRQLFNADPNQSYLYHHAVALVRTMDYLETRPEVNLARMSVMGQEWTGIVVALMHAIDNRPGAYFVWQGAGFYSDEEGNSGDLPSRIDREAYEKYSPAVYAKYGTQPIFVASPLNSDLSPLDATIEFVKNLKSTKVLSFAPNRQEVQTLRQEFQGGAWQTYFLNRLGQNPPSISNGTVSVKNGRVIYTCTASGQTAVSMLVSYGKPGNWTGRNWHRYPMKTVGNQIVGEIPIYDPKVPFYVIGQMSTKGYGERGNVPQFIDPAKLGVSAPNATYPHEIFDGTKESETYVATYSYYDAKNILFDQPGPDGMKSANIPIYWDGMVRLKNVEPRFWKGATEVRLWLKGDGKVQKGPLNVHFAYDSQNSIDREQQNYTTVTLLKTGETFPATWKEYRIPLKGIGNLQGVDSMFIETGLKPLQIAGVSWR